MSLEQSLGGLIVIIVLLTIIILFFVFDYVVTRREILDYIKEVDSKLVKSNYISLQIYTALYEILYSNEIEEDE